MQKCDRCKQECKDTAAVELRSGVIKWFCYNCYKEHKKRSVR